MNGISLLVNLVKCIIYLIRNIIFHSIRYFNRSVELSDCIFSLVYSCFRLQSKHLVDGGWAPWGEPVEIEGHSLSYRTRKCDSPLPQNGGSWCKGINIKFKSLKDNSKGMYSTDLYRLL